MQIFAYLETKKEQTKKLYSIRLSGNKFRLRRLVTWIEEISPNLYANVQIVQFAVDTSFFGKNLHVLKFNSQDTLKYL